MNNWIQVLSLLYRHKKIKMIWLMVTSVIFTVDVKDGKMAFIAYAVWSGSSLPAYAKYIGDFHYLKHQSLKVPHNSNYIEAIVV